MVRPFRHPVNAADLLDRHRSPENPFTVKAKARASSGLFCPEKSNQRSALEHDGQSQAEAEVRKAESGSASIDRDQGSQIAGR